MARSAELVTVGRALRLLQAFTAEQPSRGVTDLATELGLDKAQVHRMLTTLIQHGFAVMDPTTRKCSLGPALVPLGRQAEQSPGLRDRLEPHLQALATATGESAIVCVPDGFRYRTIAACEGPGMVRYATGVGRSYPGHLGSTGHAIFAFLPSIALADLISADGHTPSPSVMATLQSHHAHARDNGYVITEGEYDARVMAIAAPLRLGESIFGSVSVLGPPEYMRDASTEIVDAVLTAASAIEDTLRS
jgi:IclR family transcriptional regulator, acetate operon repressor